MQSGKGGADTPPDPHPVGGIDVNITKNFMNASDFVARLEKVRQTGTGRWIASCPSHPDRHPSLGVSEGDDGRVLIICRAGCAIDAIVAAVGLTVADIMPERLPDHQYKPIRKPFPAADVLEMLRTESMIVWLAGCQMAEGKILDAETKKRLCVAAARIEVAANG